MLSEYKAVTAINKCKTNILLSDERKLDNMLKDDFERAKTDIFKGPHLDDFGGVEEIEIWRDTFGPGSSWYCELITVKVFTMEEV